MMDCARQAKVKTYYREMSDLGSGRTKGWACGVAKKGGDWLGSLTGPHTKEVWTGKYARLCRKVLISYGKSNAPLQSVRIMTCYSLFREGTANAAGKELHEVLAPVSYWRA